MNFQLNLCSHFYLFLYFQHKEAHIKVSFLSEKFQQNLGTASVIVTMLDSTSIELKDQEDMIKAIVNENWKKFHQSESSCHFLHAPLFKNFGPYGTTKNIKKVLKGKYKCPGKTNKFTKLFIKSCKAKAVKTHLERSPSFFKKSWKKMKEKTGTRWRRYRYCGWFEYWSQGSNRWRKEWLSFCQPEFLCEKSEFHRTRSNC